MKRILSIAALAVVVALPASGFAVARSGAKPGAVTRNAACDRSQCTRTSCATAKGSKAETARATSVGRACPVSDPSACPASCRPGNATVATNVTQR